MELSILKTVNQPLKIKDNLDKFSVRPVGTLIEYQITALSPCD